MKNLKNSISSGLLLLSSFLPRESDAQSPSFLDVMNDLTNITCEVTENVEQTLDYQIGNYLNSTTAISQVDQNFYSFENNNGLSFINSVQFDQSPTNFDFYYLYLDGVYSRNLKFLIYSDQGNFKIDLIRENENLTWIDQ